MPLAHKTVHVFTDSMVAAAYVNNQHATSDDAVTLLHRLADTCHRYNIHVVCVHVPGECNAIADAISRFHERGQIYRFVSLLWSYFGKYGVIPVGYFLPAHMSYNSCAFLSPQIATWTATYARWIRRYAIGDLSPLHRLQRPPIDRRRGSMSLSVRPWVSVRCPSPH